ncbi:hypothetical protein [Microbacterium lacticum]|uniref:hypothetical protein n=1 Tax=Microbacterium lacticum TaxID=33885 RepID=UPI0028D4FDAF|nr:hypothetical protein [Microbacterium lacticum]
MTRAQRRRPASDRAARTRDEASWPDSLTRHRHAPEAELISALTTYAKRPSYDEALARVLGASRRDLLAELIGLPVVVFLVAGSPWHGRLEAVDDRAILVEGFVIPLGAVVRIKASAS